MGHPPYTRKALYITKYMEPFLMDRNKEEYIMLLKSCARCGNLIPYGSIYCNECTPIVEAEREARIQESRLKSNRAYNKRRDPKYVRFYNSIDWRALSMAYAQAKGYRCERCNAMATQVHHKIPIQTPEGWELRLDYDNLELLCTQCHNETHSRFLKGKDKWKRT